MIEFNIAALSCGHCVRAVTEAVHQVDPAAKVEVDLARKQVQVESALARQQLSAALVEAGYPPSP